MCKVYEDYFNYYSSVKKEADAMERLSDFNLDLKTILSGTEYQNCQTADFLSPTQIVALLEKNHTIDGHLGTFVLRRYPDDILLTEQRESIYYRALQIGNMEIIRCTRENLSELISPMFQWFKDDPCFKERPKKSEWDYSSKTISQSKVHSCVFKTFLPEFIRSVNDRRELKWSRQQWLIAFTVFAVYADKCDLYDFYQKFIHDFVCFSNEEWGVVLLNVAIKGNVERTQDLIEKSQYQTWPNSNQKDVIGKALIKKLSRRCNASTLTWLTHWFDPSLRKAVEPQFEEYSLTTYFEKYKNNPLKLAKCLRQSFYNLFDAETTEELFELLESHLVFLGVEQPNKLLTNAVKYHLCFQMFYPPSHLLETVSKQPEFPEMFREQWFLTQEKRKPISWLSLLSKFKPKALRKFLEIAKKKEIFSQPVSEVESKSELIIPEQNLDQCYQALLQYLVANESTEDDEKKLDKFVELLNEHLCVTPIILSDDKGSDYENSNDENSDDENSDYENSDDENSDDEDSDDGYSSIVVDDTTLSGMMTLTMEFSSGWEITILRRYLNILDRLLNEPSRYPFLPQLLLTNLFKIIWNRKTPFIYMWLDWYHKQEKAIHVFLMETYSSSKCFPKRLSLIEKMLQNLTQLSITLINNSCNEGAENSVAFIVDTIRRFDNREPSTTDLLELMTGYIDSIVFERNPNRDKRLFQTNSRANLIPRYILGLARYKTTSYNATTFLCKFFIDNPFIGGQLIIFYITELRGEINPQSVIAQLQDANNRMVPLIHLARFLIHGNRPTPKLQGVGQSFFMPLQFATPIEDAIKQTLRSQTLTVHQKHRLQCFADLNALIMLELLIMRKISASKIFLYCMKFAFLRQIGLLERNHILILASSKLHKLEAVESKLKSTLSSIVQSASIPKHLACAVEHRRPSAHSKSEEFSCRIPPMDFFRRMPKSHDAAFQQLLEHYMIKMTCHIAIFYMPRGFHQLVNLSLKVSPSYRNQFLMALVISVNDLVHTFISPAVQQFALTCIPILNIQRQPNPRTFYQSQCPSFAKMFKHYLNEGSQEEEKAKRHQKFVDAITSRSSEKLAEVLTEAYLSYHKSERRQASVLCDSHPAPKNTP